MSLLLKTRKGLACLPAVALLAIAVHSALKADLAITPHYDDSSVEVALVDAAELQPPPPEPEAQPEPPPPEPEIAEAPVVEAPPPPPKPKPKVQPPKPAPVAPRPAVAKAEPVQKPAPAAPVAAAQAPVVPPAPPAPPKANPGDLENRYVARLLAELEKYKQYPRGREASLQRPTGNVVVWLLVDRSGTVLDTGIEQKATNMLLNRAAQTSLRRIEKVAPFPQDVFAGKDKYRFSATLVYNLEEN